MSVEKNLFITGLPGVGKTTLIRKMAGELGAFHPAGFYTEEIRRQGIRQGFELIGLDRRRGILSHIDFKSGPRVGRYGVDVPGFEAFLQGLPKPGPGTRLFIIDEIGKMECLSEKFRAWLTSLLDSRIPVVATIALRGTPFIESIKRRPDVKIYEMTLTNRDALPECIIRDAVALSTAASML